MSYIMWSRYFIKNSVQSIDVMQRGLQIKLVPIVTLQLKYLNSIGNYSPFIFTKYI